MQNSKTPMINSVIAVGLNIVLNLVLIRNWGYIGLAIATTISISISAILFSYSLSSINHYISFKKNIINSLTILCIALLMGGIVYYLHNLLISNDVYQFTALIIAIVVGFIVYFAVIYAFNISSMRDSIDTYIKRFISVLRMK